MRGSAVERFRSVLLIVGLIVSALLGTVFAILPAALTIFLPIAVLLPASSLAKAAWQMYRAVVDTVAAFWFTHASALLEWVAGTSIYVTGSGRAPDPANERTILIICNHRCRLDWMCAAEPREHRNTPFVGASNTAC